MSTGAEGTNPKEKGWYPHPDGTVRRWTGKKWGRTLQANSKETGPATHSMSFLAVLFLILSYLGALINSLYFYQQFTTNPTQTWADSAKIFASGQYFYELITLLLAILGWIKGKATLPIIVLVLLVVGLPAVTVVLIGLSGN